MQTLTISPTLPSNALNATPILAGYYYAIADNTNNAHSKNSEYTFMQISDITRTNGKTQLKIQQFAQTYKVLPEFINPAYLGMPVAQFWLDMRICELATAIATAWCSSGFGGLNKHVFKIQD